MEDKFALPMREQLLKRLLSSSRRFHREHLIVHKTVAEHTTDVVIKALWIALVLIPRGHKLDLIEVLIRGVVHDQEEKITGDIPHTIKYQATEDLIFKQTLDLLGLQAITTLYSQMPLEVSRVMVPAWQKYKDREGIESQIVKLADLLSGLAECIEERELGNQTLLAEEERYQQLYRQARAEYGWTADIADVLPEI